MSSGFDFFFFFQAEDGIRDGHVTGVQTCALPIFRSVKHSDVRRSNPLRNEFLGAKSNSVCFLLIIIVFTETYCWTTFPLRNQLHGTGAASATGLFQNSIRQAHHLGRGTVVSVELDHLRVGVGAAKFGEIAWGGPRE